MVEIIQKGHLRGIHSIFTPFSSFFLYIQEFTNHSVTDSKCFLVGLKYSQGPINDFKSQN
jgi:hypothetical protein